MYTFTVPLAFLGSDPSVEILLLRGPEWSSPKSGRHMHKWAIILCLQYVLIRVWSVFGVHAHILFELHTHTIVRGLIIVIYIISYPQG